MTTLDGPEVLTMPEKMKPIITEFNNYDYILAEGGRGGAKSWSIAKFLSYVGEKRKVRIVCGREVQNTIEESVYTIFRDIIARYGLNYEIFHDKIIHRTTKSEIKFKGFRERGAASIKGLEGVDILWVDEAQAITKGTLDVILPTIRKLNSRVFWSMNRSLRNDPVYAEFRNREDCLHIHINYTDNPFLTPKLAKEAARMKIESPEDYQHIWMGQPQADGGNMLFNEANFEACYTRTFPHDPNKYGAMVLGGDVARFGDNFSVALVLRQVGPEHWEEHYIERWKKQDGVYSTGKFSEVLANHNCEYGVIDSDGLGGIVFDYLSKSWRNVIAFHGGKTSSMSKPDKERYKNPRNRGYHLLNDMVNNGRLRLKSPFLTDQAREIRYTYDSASRKYVIPKEQLIEAARRRGVKFASPDDLDALMMAVSVIDQVGIDQKNMFATTHGRVRGGSSAYYSTGRGGDYY
jgi:hypothetical protein